jgi:hypothetical protein
LSEHTTVDFYRNGAQEPDYRVTFDEGVSDEDVAEFEERWLANYRATPPHERHQVMPHVSEHDGTFGKPGGEIVAMALFVVAAISLFAADVGIGVWLW